MIAASVPGPQQQQKPQEERTHTAAVHRKNRKGHENIQKIILLIFANLKLIYYIKAQKTENYTQFAYMNVLGFFLPVHHSCLPTIQNYEKSVKFAN